MFSSETDEVKENYPDFDNLKEKHPTNWSKDETERFIHYKEAQYSRRRDRVQHYCSIQDETFSRKVLMVDSF